MADRAVQYFNEGVNFAKLGRHTEAVASFDKVLAINPNFAEAWYGRGLALLNLGRHGAAVASFDKALAINPNFANAWINRGVAFHYLGRHTETLASYDKAAAIKPNSANAWINRGLTLGELGRYTEAVDSYDKAIAINPDLVDAWNNHGVALNNLGRHVEALASYDKAVAIKPDYAYAWINRGLTLNNLGRHAEAVAAFDKVLNLDPNNVKVWNIKGDALKELKRYEEAVAAYDRVAQLDPQNESALVEKKELLTKIHLEQQQYREKEDRKTLIQRIKETESFGALPTPIKDAVLQPNALLYPDEVIATLSQLDEFLTTARPQINLVLSRKQVALDTWEKGKISLTNEGSAHAKNITFEFSDDIDVRRIKTVDVLAGETKQFEIPIKAKVKGTIPLDITVTYRDARDKSFSDTFDFDIEVLEKGTTARSPVDGFTPEPLTPKQLLIIRGFEFYAGYIRLKISVKNPTPLTIHDVILEPDVDRAILYLERHEPEEYPSENEKIILGSINPHNDRTVSLYLEPTICAKEGTDVHCHVRYKDAQGQPGSLDMEPLRIQVVCPIFDTKEPVNIGSLKQLIDSLPSKDTKIFSVPRNLDAETQLKIFQGVIQRHDIRHISTLRRANNFESWYYGRTKVSQKDIVIKLGVVKDMDMVEITAFSYDPKDLTGLLADINRHVTEEVSKRGNVQKIFNVSIKDSVVQRTNLMSFCDAEGKCSGDVTIADSVVTGSNIA